MEILNPKGFYGKDFYLFLLVSECLPRMIIREESSSLIHWIKTVRHSPTISHLLYADDIVMFMRANENEAIKIRKILEIYCTWSDQRINKQKSTFFSSKTLIENTKINICNQLDITRI